MGDTSSFCLRCPSFNSVWLSRVFATLDNNGDGTFTAAEISKALTRLGMETAIETAHKSTRVDLVSRVHPESEPVPVKSAVHEGLVCFVYSPDSLLMLDLNSIGDVKACAEAEAFERSTDNPQHDVWLHAPKGRRLLRLSKPEQARDFAWLGMLNDAAFETHNLEEWTSMGIVTFEKVCTMDTIPNRSPLSAEAKFSYFSPFQSQNRPTSEHIHLEANLQSKYAGTGLNEDIETEVAQSNTPTAHALRAWAWSNGRSGGTGFRWRCGSFSRMSFPLCHTPVGVSEVVVCFEAFRWISILLLDFGKSDRDLLPHSCSESIDPSVNGCTSRQRSWKGGRTETLDATGEILCLWGNDDYLIFLVLYLYYDIYLYLYYDIYCNRRFFV